MSPKCAHIKLKLAALQTAEKKDNVDLLLAVTLSGVWQRELYVLDSV